MDFNTELKQLMRELHDITQNARRTTKANLNKSSRILVDAIQQRAPKGKRAHKRYSTPKIAKGMRAPKGKGVVVATYQPGNLRLSVQTLRLPRARYSVYVGAKLGKNKNTMPDGYYAHMVEFGTRKMAAQPFVRPAVQAVGTAVQNDIIRRMRASLKRKKR